MSVTTLMAKKKAKPPQREDVVRIRVTPQFKVWLEGFSDSNQLTMSDTIVQALIALAKTQGHEPPPKR